MINIQLTILILAINEEKNIAKLIPAVHRIVSQITSDYEIILVDGGSTDKTRGVAVANKARVIRQRRRGYGEALREGFENSKGKYILTLDADLSHSPDFISAIWEERTKAEIIIASRYVPGGEAIMPWVRRVLSRILNIFFARGLSIPVKDISSGFRLYNSSIVRNLTLNSTDFDILEEIVIQTHIQGWRVKEISFCYAPRESGSSKAKLFKFGISYLKTFKRMWVLRNSIMAADYDERAFDSIIPFQRYWQRSRYKIITQFAGGDGLILDIGCGSSRILRGLNEAIGIDIQMNKVRYMKRYDKPVINASIYDLPFKSKSFDCIICSQVIEHIPYENKIFQEMERVLKEGGKLILGTPDYAKLSWRIIERLYKFLIPGGYADEHITHYSKDNLISIIESFGFSFERIKYVLDSEMIIVFIKDKSD